MSSTLSLLSVLLLPVASRVFAYENAGKRNLLFFSHSLVKITIYIDLFWQS